MNVMYLDRVERTIATLSILGLLFCSVPAFGGQQAVVTHEREAGPYESQIQEQLERLGDSSPAVRSAGAEALGFLRAYAAADALVSALDDPAAVVRRDAAISLAWCGGRTEVAPLLDALDDDDWVVRQAAWVSLTNITGMEWPYDALADVGVREVQAQVWRDGWARIPGDRPPEEVFELVEQRYSLWKENLALRSAATASSTYKGPPSALTDGVYGPAYWQTKDCTFPQTCTVELDRPKTVGSVVIHQYAKGYCMTDYVVMTSLDGRDYGEVYRGRGRTNPRLVVSFPPHQARCIRIVSNDSENRLYPTTFLEIEIFSDASPDDDLALLRMERGLRALGALGGDGAAEAIAKTLRPIVKLRTAYRQTAKGTLSSLTDAEKAMVRAGLRSLGRLQHPETLPLLIGFLEDPILARYAADALGDFGGVAACMALIDAYPQYARGAEFQKPKKLPLDDCPGFEAVDRMYETPFAIASALARLSLDDPDTVAGLARITPLLVANLPNDFDGAVLYEPEAGQLITAYLLERAGTRQMVCDVAFNALGQSRDLPDTSVTQQLTSLAKLHPGDVPHAAVWLAALCQNERDSPALIELLQHDNGWVRINAAKALMFMGDKRAIEPIARILAASKPEAEYGYFGGYFSYDGPQGHDEYNDPSPRWREAFIRALGRLRATQHEDLLARILVDERNVLDMQHAAALALDEMGGGEALEALQQAEQNHPFHSVRLVAREALWRRGQLPATRLTSGRKQKPLESERPRGALLSETSTQPEAIVFIQGDNEMPLAFQIDPWRQTYSTTDSGPTYRLGTNLLILRPAGPNGYVTSLTSFDEGYLSDCEVSWDGRRVVFARRGGDDDPWFHIWEVNTDGTGLRQLTRGPYHDVQPVYLYDGRIAFSSSRIGMRDEYHGYLATGLTVMNGDGSDIHCIGFSLGRDNEPAVLNDGRIGFSRLQLFYSRLKTELTIQAVSPDGSKNVTLYGPERRAFWENVTRESGERWWGEAPPRHRVLRLTQPQSFGQGRVICATTGGLTLVGPGRYEETFVPHDKKMAVTSPYPLDDGRILCAATAKVFESSGTANATNVDLGLYWLNAETGALTELYNNPETAEFEPRPVMARRPPDGLIEAPQARSRAYTARLFCGSIRNSQEKRVTARGKLVRVIEGRPVVGRHHSHTSKLGEAWKNHTGTNARVLGTAPLAADGSFFLEVPADRLIHLQVLDSDRNVVGNQQIWMYARPGETRSCAGCHEKPNTTPKNPQSGFPLMAKTDPVKCLPTGGEFSYRAKLWNKGTLSDEGEARTRTVRAVNLIGRY